MLHGISASISKSAFAALALTMGVSVSGAVFAQDWEETVAAAAGQTVFFQRVGR